MQVLRETSAVEMVRMCEQSEMKAKMRRLIEEIQGTTIQSEIELKNFKSSFWTQFKCLANPAIKMP